MIFLPWIDLYYTDSLWPEDGDELISTDLTERERLYERLELKKKKPVYSAYDEDVPGEKGILAQYDEEIDGKKKKRFVLDGSGNSADINAHREDVVEKLKAKSIIINLDIPSQYSKPFFMIIALLTDRSMR